MAVVEHTPADITTTGVPSSSDDAAGAPTRRRHQGSEARRELLEKLNQEDLADLLRSRGMKTSGLKVDQISRLLSAHKVPIVSEECAVAMRYVAGRTGRRVPKNALQDTQNGDNWMADTLWAGRGR